MYTEFGDLAYTEGGDPAQYLRCILWACLMIMVMMMMMMMMMGGVKSIFQAPCVCVYFSGWVSCAGDVDFYVITTGCAARSRCNSDSCESNDYRLERPAGLSSLAVEVE